MVCAPARSLWFWAEPKQGGVLSTFSPLTLEASLFVSVQMPAFAEMSDASYDWQVVKQENLAEVPPYHI